MERANFTATDGYSHSDDRDVCTQWTGTAHGNASVLILYATATGTAEALAKKFAAKLQRFGIPARVRDAAQSQPSILSQASSVLLIASTYGDGEPPDDAVPFWEAVVQGKGLDLQGIEFSVLALGNSTFDQFCKCGRDFDAALERHGATRFYPRVDCDIDYEAPAEQWMDGVLMSLQQDIGSALAA